MNQKTLRKELVLAAGLLTIVVGLVHLLPAAFSHYTPFPPLETLFFVTIGLGQIIWGLLFIKKPTVNHYYIGLALNGGAAFFWLLTRTLPAPFQSGPEHVDLLSTSVFVAELIAVICLLFWEEITDKIHLIRNTLFAIITILVIGGALYGITNALELVFPDRNVGHHEEMTSDPTSTSDLDQLPHMDKEADHEDNSHGH